MNSRILALAGIMVGLSACGGKDAQVVDSTKVVDSTVVVDTAVNQTGNNQTSQQTGNNQAGQQQGNKNDTSKSPKHGGKKGHDQQGQH